MFSFDLFFLLSSDVTQNDSEFCITIWDRANKEDDNNEEFLGYCTVRPARIDGVLFPSRVGCFFWS